MHVMQTPQQPAAVLPVEACPTGVLGNSHNDCCGNSSCGCLVIWVRGVAQPPCDLCVVSDNTDSTTSQHTGSPTFQTL